MNNWLVWRKGIIIIKIIFINFYIFIINRVEEALNYKNELKNLMKLENERLN